MAVFSVLAQEATGEAVARVAARKAIRALAVSPNRGASGQKTARTVWPDMRAIIFDALTPASVRAEISHGNPQRASIVTPDLHRKAGRTAVGIWRLVKIRLVDIGRFAD